MDSLEQLKTDLQQGRIDALRLVDLLGALQRQLHAAQQRIVEQQTRISEQSTRIAELEKQVGGAATAKVEEPFSMRAEEQRQEARGKKKRQRKAKKRRGRRTSAEKIKHAQRHQDVFPEGIVPEQCWLSHTRVVWRLVEGRAVQVAYHIYRGRQNRYGQIPGVVGRSEFGLEFLVEVAHLVYVMGMSLDKVCQVLQFFQNLPLGKSQAEALLRQLSGHWQEEFETLCTLLAHAAVVHADETGWSLQSVWALVSEKARVLLFGVPKDGETLQTVLDAKTFAGLLISDDAAVYGNYSQSQKCWAHLLRKAIKLTLQEPDNAEYRTFTDRLLEIYRAACRVQRDGRLGDAGRARKVTALDDAIVDLCLAMWSAELPPLDDGPADDYRRLCNELMRLMLNQELFTFVTARPAQQPNGQSQPVSGTNNEAERTLRGVATARKTGRTNKTKTGARRQTILVSVLESLRLYLPSFTLGSVLEEILRWQETGQSCFSKLLKSMKLPPPSKSILDAVLPIPDGC